MIGIRQLFNWFLNFIFIQCIFRSNSKIDLLSWGKTAFNISLMFYLEAKDKFWLVSIPRPHIKVSLICNYLTIKFICLILRLLLHRASMNELFYDYCNSSKKFFSHLDIVLLVPILPALIFSMKYKFSYDLLSNVKFGVTLNNS